jgi:hypothetical protein
MSSGLSASNVRIGSGSSGGAFPPPLIHTYLVESESPFLTAHTHSPAQGGICPPVTTSEFFLLFLIAEFVSLYIGDFH